MTNVRVRFAPSPTGTLHIGGARTALFNWLFARKHNGSFILRLEDTDTLRSTEDSVRAIVDGLRWLGLDWDEGPDVAGSFGPYRQSERLSLYRFYLQKLIDEGKAYYCFCSPEEIQAQKEKARNEKRNYRYEGCCSKLSPEEVQKRLDIGMKPVIRIKMPSEGKTVVHDLVRGDVEFDNALLDDFIIAKSDGWPTYNFAVVIDDANMQISHVIRAEEHLSNTPKQLHIYDALHLKTPLFAHVSMILAPDRSKLSKRHGATSVQEFRDDGYLPEALVNYLALLGWSPGDDTTLMQLTEMIERFELDNVSKSAAIYDIQKLAWMNGHYISSADISAIIPILKEKAEAKKWLRNDNLIYFTKVVDLLRSRAKTTDEILEQADYFFESPLVYDEKGAAKYFCKDNSINMLETVLSIIKELPVFSAETIENAFRAKANLMEVKAGTLIHPTRLALSGRTNTPGLFEVMELLGSELCIARISKAIDYVKSFA